MCVCVSSPVVLWSVIFRMDVSFLMLCVLLSVTSVGSGIQVGAGSQSVTVQPWLVGLSAVVGFLLIVFIILIVRRVLKRNRSDTHTHTHSLTVSSLSTTQHAEVSLGPKFPLTAVPTRCE
uniref:Uncharacterized protein n=1 Tax=Scophthalmus maximus TaxID=52904 RepID=A0A8D2ZXL4_SCOMX